VPIAIAGSRLCTEAILSDLAIPLPESYAGKPPSPKSALDFPHPRPLLYRAEDLIWRLYPYVIGSLMALTLVFVWAYCTGRLATTHTSPSPHTLDSQYLCFPILKTMSPLALPGVATVMFLMVVLVTLS
jgi:hypothetical protein